MPRFEGDADGMRPLLHALKLNGSGCTASGESYTAFCSSFAAFGSSYTAFESGCTASGSGCTAFGAGCIAALICVTVTSELTLLL